MDKGNLKNYFGRCLYLSLMLGCNFGLTNLVMALKRAKELNRLPMNVDRLVRHTDGGPDNVAWVTHFFHWLLVYLGIFNEVLWFRFEAIQLSPLPADVSGR